MERKYILYADDDIDDRFILKSLIGQIDNNLDLVCVANGFEAVTYLDALSMEELPCFILLDINMPKMDGFVTLQFLKRSDRYRSIPVILYSTSSDRHDVNKADSLGAERMITKPFEIADIRRLANQFAQFCHEASARKKDALGLK